MHDAWLISAARRAGRPRRFWSDESGSMTVFTMFLLVAMLIVGGMAVDFQRFESRRALLQSTLDRAVLAAADLDQPRDPEEVVRDYFAKAGLLEQLKNVEVTVNLNAKTVSAVAELEMNTIFLRMLGLPELTAPAGGTATESVSDVEISLVLDVSGSMGREGRIENLRVAAADFIDTIFDGIETDHLSVSLVPYSTQVSLPEPMFDLYTTRYGHDFSHCIELPAAGYDTTALPPGDLYNQVAPFDPDSGAYYNSIQRAERFVCNPRARAEILPVSGNRATLLSRIADLQPYEWTSIEMGTKWGVALLDAATRPVVDGLIAAGVVDGTYAGRPYDYGTQDNLKVMVVMTDGENTRDYVLSPALRDQLADVWQDGDTFYVEDEEAGDRDGDGISNEDYWLPAVDSWTDANAGVQLSWNELFSQVAIRAHAWNFRADQYDTWNDYYTTWYDSILEATYTATKDARLDRVCSAAKAQGIIVFTIGFEVSDRSADVMESCASSPSHFYRVEDVEILTAFASIANQINALRLVQ